MLVTAIITCLLIIVIFTRKNQGRWIYTDVGGTLIQNHGKREFVELSKTDPEAALEMIDPNVMNWLNEAKQKGYKLGILSNTSVPAHELEETMIRTGLDKTFEHVLWLNDPECKKPSKCAFDKLHPNTHAYIGNNPEKDISQILSLRVPGSKRCSSLGCFDGVIKTV
jgi:hypothetical protein